MGTKRYCDLCFVDMDIDRYVTLTADKSVEDTNRNGIKRWEVCKECFREFNTFVSGRRNLAEKEGNDNG